MPPRVARSSIQSNSASKPRTNGGRNPKKAAKRALNAFSIAQYENPEKVKISRNRLGEVEQSGPVRKRARDSDDEEGSDEDDAEPKRRRRGNNEEYDEGSDSDGNTWTMGHIDVDGEDDEDIDSDEAFGESDEERFEDFTFRGSSKPDKSKGNAKGKTRAAAQSDEEDFDLNEGDDSDGEEDEDDLGEDAIDLATALDQYEEDEAEEKRERERKKKKSKSAFDDSEDPASDEDVFGPEDGSDSSSDEDEDGDRQAQLNDLISALATKEDQKRQGRKVDVHESSIPDEFGVSRKVDILSFKPKVADEEKKRSLKLLQDDKSSKRNDIARKLDAPLPKRQQDKIDRAAANTKTNETLDRWTDTIKSNRRAEHLMFPLQHKSGGETIGENRLQPTTTDVPANDLESTIQSILQQSGLSNGKEDEEKMQKWEELQTNKLPLEEVMKRRAQLRMERELLFREEIRAKRIKKIKSKAYRRVHRKEREKLLEKERAQLKADGVDLSEDEREYNDRRRAEERMGAKHRESKWAKGVKATGRAAWDQDALDGVTEMARRNDELRRRIEGKTIRDEDEDASDLPSDDDESEEDSDADMQQSLGKLKHNPFKVDNSKLGSMAFMQKAEAARRTQNDEAVEQMRREMAGEDGLSEDDAENATKVGKRKYGPGKELTLPAIPTNRSEFEERPDSDEEVSARPARNGDQGAVTNGKSKKSTKASGPLAQALEKKQKAHRKETSEDESGSQNPFLIKAKKEKKRKGVDTEDDALLPLSTEPAPKPNSKPAPKSLSGPHETKVDTFLQQKVTIDDDGWATVVGGQDSEEDNDDLEDEGIDLTSVLRNQALTAKGFAGDNVAASFTSEKKAIIASEEATEIVSHLPGWGAWTGDGMTAAQRQRNKGLTTITKKDGIAADKRKDRKLDKVIINEKRAKPTGKYMAQQLPFPFENREQYERSLRVPKGKEWTTKKTFQDATRPRVIVKQGIVRAMRKPLV